MKNHLKSIICILLLSFIACEKAENFENNIDGTWELRHVKGIQIAGMSPDFPPGNGYILKIDGNTYQRFHKGAAVSSGTFAVIKTELEIDGIKFPFKLDFDQANDIDVFAKMSGKKLILSIGSIASDGTTSTYERL